MLLVASSDGKPMPRPVLRVASSIERKRTYMSKKFLMIFAAAMLAFGLFGCAGQSSTEQTTDQTAQEQGSGESGAEAESGPVTEYASGAVKVVLDGGSDPIEFEIEVKDGEQLLYVSNMDSDDCVEVVTSLFEGDSTDYFYEGYGFSMGQYDTGKHTVTVNPNGVSGTLIATSYPEDGVDLMNDEPEDIFNKISDEVCK